MTSALVIEKLMKRFDGLTALRWVDLEVPQHAIAGVIGPNGAGKTTLFNCISGVYAPDAGTISFMGRVLNELAPDEIVRTGIARTYQNSRLFTGMSVLEHVLLGMHSRLKTGFVGAVLRLPRAKREERAAYEEALALLSFVGLSHAAHQNAQTLSYGAQRRLEIARALAARPQLLLLDEPTASLGTSETESMIRLIRQLRDQQGITFVLIEHDMQVVMSVCEQVTVLDYGQKVAEGSPAEVQRDPRVIEAYLGGLPEDLLE